ncbi:MAG: hypothetical protein RI897_2797 [Verrucomicrobiota bacterium]|jgi:hypothetical protein
MGCWLLVVGCWLLVSESGVGVKGSGYEVPSLKCGDWRWDIGYGRLDMGYGIGLGSGLLAPGGHAWSY